MKTRGYFGIGCLNMKTSMNYGSLFRTARAVVTYSVKATSEQEARNMALSICKQDGIYSGYIQDYQTFDAGILNLDETYNMVN